MLNNNEINDLEKEIINTKVRIVKEYKSDFHFQIINNIIGKDENSSSIICKLAIDKYNILFMGDASKKEERIYLTRFKSKIDIIKLGHHGSKTSSGYDFLKAIKVNEAIISSGRNNLYHHPSKETLDNLKSLNIKYYNTQDNGTIKYIFRHNDYAVITYPP